ncbi:MAG TPA: hypothetical protein VNC62_00195 [Burkholderiales bacterium]|nr:hypothetical protein [Burkholderiales bacterium]
MRRTFEALILGCAGFEGSAHRAAKDIARDIRGQLGDVGQIDRAALKARGPH